MAAAQPNIIAEPKALAGIVAALKSIPDRRNTIPICGHYLLEAKGGDLTITASDLDIEASITVQIKASIAPVCLPPYLIEAAAGVAGTEAKFLIDERRASVSAGRARFTAPVLPGHDFPRFSLEFRSRAELPGKQLASLFASTLDAVSSEETRWYLQGVFLQIHTDGRLHAVATDGHRLHTTSIIAPDGLDLGDGAIVPPKAAQEFARLGAKAGDALVTLEVSDTKMAVTSGPERVASKLVDGTFPDWRRVLPAPSGTSATFDIAEFIAALGRVMKMQAVNEIGKKSESKTSGVKIAEDGDFLKISTSAGEVEATDAVGAEFQGEFGALGASAKYLMATLTAMRERGADTVIMDTANAGSPIRFESPADEDFVGCVMPMRL